MPFSLLHISDLHRDLSDEIGNNWLLDSLEKDFCKFNTQTPILLTPSLSIVSGDLVYGISPGAADGAKEIERQYAQAEEFLIGLADRFFEGDRERIVILPGNHDVCYEDVMMSAQKIGIPPSAEDRKQLVAELFRPNSRLRWSWGELCFYKIADEERYRNRLAQFGALYKSFYQGKRSFPLLPEQQHAVFDFPEHSLCIVALNSCYNNDPLRRAGAFHPTALTEACRALRQPQTYRLVDSSYVAS
jgi:hypothetical protein